MADEARKMWLSFITAPENAHLLKRYAKSAKEPAPLFDSIGEDLGSSNKEVREFAYWALVAAMPELTSILYEREIRHPGWRDREGKDQQMINRGTDILTDLHREFVVEHRFKIHGRYGKDPRPYVNRAIRNREFDLKRKRKREVLLDYDVALTIPDPAASLEDTVLESIQYEELKREIRNLLCRGNDDEFTLFETVHVDATPLDELRESLGIPSKPALRQRISRANRKIVAERDGIFTFFLIVVNEFALQGKLPRDTRPLKRDRDEEWVKRAKLSIQPGGWLNGLAADGKNRVAVRALTRSFSHAPGYIYLAAVLKDFQPLCGGIRILHAVMGLDWSYEGGSCGTLMDDGSLIMRAYDIDELSLQYAERLINAPYSKIQRGTHPLNCLLEAHSTELPGLNAALADIPDDYNLWLISYTFVK